MRILQFMGEYAIFLKGLFKKPEKPKIFLQQTLLQMETIGLGSFGIVALISVFVGAVSTITIGYQLLSGIIPDYVLGRVVRDSNILEFSPTITCLVLAGKVGSNIASEIGTMKVTEQIDALEIMGINSAAYLALPKIIAGIFITPFIVLLSMFLGIIGGWFAGDLSGSVPSADFIRGIQDQFVPFNIVFAMVKSLVFAFIITSVSSFQGYFTNGGALEVGQSSTKAVVYSSIIVLLFDYILTQLLLA